MPTAVVHMTRRELEKRRRALLAEVRGTYEALRERAESYQLTAAERDVWETIRTIDYLLDDG